MKYKYNKDKITTTRLKELPIGTVFCLDRNSNDRYLKLSNNEDDNIFDLIDNKVCQISLDIDCFTFNVTIVED